MSVYRVSVRRGHEGELVPTVFDKGEAHQRLLAAVQAYAKAIDEGAEGVLLERDGKLLEEYCGLQGRLKEEIAAEPRRKRRPDRGVLDCR